MDVNGFSSESITRLPTTQRFIPFIHSFIIHLISRQRGLEFKLNEVDKSPSDEGAMVVDLPGDKDEDAMVVDSVAIVQSDAAMGLSEGIGFWL